ncbi:MAG: gas vesicle protein K [Thaumarchaeota archaeon]|nr:gas vesicle protein K [Nitrososphaerota archaeon]
MERAVQKSRKRQVQSGAIDFGEGGQKMQQGLAKLTLTVMEVLRQALERQAIRRVESGTLSEEQIERMGLAFMNMGQEMTRVTKKMGLDKKELDATLGSLLKTADGSLGGASLVDLLDRLLERGAVIAGQVKVSVSDVDLVGLDLLAMLYPIYGERRWLDGQPVALDG